MNKSEFISIVAEQADLKKSEANDVVTVVFDVISEIMESEDKISIKGFGTFSGVCMPERKGRNPHSGESITIPERTVPKFKPSPALKERVRG